MSKPLSLRERKGPAPQAWEGEGLRPFRPYPLILPLASRAGPSFSPWEKAF